MLRKLATIAVVVLIALFAGAGSAWYALSGQIGVGALNVGPWTAYPLFGGMDADPYSEARAAREGVLSLGRGEGISFTASDDSRGAGLRRECDYTVQGTVPGARFWTLYATDRNMVPLATGERRRPSIISQQVLRRPDNSFAITVSRNAAPGNWLPTEGRGRLRLVLTLYDTPTASNTGLTEVELPEIVRGQCNA